MFALAGVEYEDHRIEWPSDDWNAFKSKTPLGQLPLLEVDGKVFFQSVAITRYLGNKFGFAGKTDLEKLQADTIVDCIVDMINSMESIVEEADETKKKELLQAYEPKLEKQLGNLENMLEANNGGNGFFVGDSVTWADCIWAGLAQWMYYRKYGPAVAKHTKLAGLRSRVEAEPRIAEWVAKRPKAEY